MPHWGYLFVENMVDECYRRAVGTPIMQDSHYVAYVLTKNNLFYKQVMPTAYISENFKCRHNL
jgi:hypothetical protein